MNPSDKSVKRALRSCIPDTTCNSVQPLCATSAPTNASGMIPITSPPAAKAEIGNRAHQPQTATAIDDTNAAFRKHASDRAGCLDIDRVFRCCRTAIDRESLHYSISSNISPAVAFALPTTPGMPAPGCVPAPTKVKVWNGVVAVVDAEIARLPQHRLKTERTAQVRAQVGPKSAGV